MGPGWLPARLRKERPAAPLRGYKLAYPMVSLDGTRGGFSGVTIGRSTVYGTLATAVCAQGAQHRSPSRWCDCGFYCVHSAAEARELACDPDYRHAVMLAVAASGRFLRYERGLRYARQRVTAVWAGRCGCGRPATTFTEAGAGLPGWRRLAGTCAACADGRPGLSLDGFARVLGGTPVRLDDVAALDQAVLDRAGLDQAGLDRAGPDQAGLATPAAARSRQPPAGAPPGRPRTGGPLEALPAGRALDDVDRAALMPVLAAEVSLLQARLDEVQRQLDRLTG